MNIKKIEKDKLLSIINSSVLDVEKSVSAGSIYVKNSQTIDDPMQNYILNSLSCIDSRIIKPIIVSSIIDIEARCPGSSKISLLLFSSIMLDKRKNNKQKINQILKHIELNGELVSKEDCKNLIFKNFHHPEISKILESVIDSLTSTSTVVTKRTFKKESYIVKKDGFVFRLKIDDEFINDGKIEKIYPNILLIDGYVETVGEIHSILETASSDNEPYIIFARRFSPEVMSTISYNNKRKTIDVIPISLGYEYDNINTLVDISACTNCEIVSTQTGDTISGSSLPKVKKIKKAIIGKNKIELFSDPDKDALDKHITYLYEKRNNSKAISDIDDLFKIIDSRLNSMLRNNITVYIGNNAVSADPNIMQKIDIFFREFRSSIKLGNIDNRTKKLLKEDFYFDKDMSFFFPRECIYMGILNAISLKNMLKSLGLALVEDN
jgi:hypothetical protein